MATLSELKVDVSKRLLDTNNTAVSSDSVIAAINDSITYWKKRKFWFNTVIGDQLALTQTNGSVPAFANFLAPASKDGGFYIYYSQQRYPLTRVDQQFYDSWYMQNGYGMPRYYTFSGDKGFQVYPLPDRAYPIGGNYLKDYTPLALDSDSNDFTVYAKRLIELQTLSDLMYELRQDSNMGGIYAARAKDEYGNLSIMNEKKAATSELTLYM